MFNGRDCNKVNITGGEQRPVTRRPHWQTSWNDNNPLCRKRPLHIQTGETAHRWHHTISETTTLHETTRIKCNTQQIRSIRCERRGGGTIDWISNLVLTPKADPTKIRMSVDMNIIINKAIRRTRYIPTLEELRYKVNSARYFSKHHTNAQQSTGSKSSNQATDHNRDQIPSENDSSYFIPNYLTITTPLRMLT